MSEPLQSITEVPCRGCGHHLEDHESDFDGDGGIGACEVDSCDCGRFRGSMPWMRTLEEDK